MKNTKMAESLAIVYIYIYTIFYKKDLLDSLEREVALGAI